jgi:predicted DNA-binding protein
MASELIDFRGYITPLTDHFLTALSESTGKPKNEIVRELLDDVAKKKIDEISLASKYLKSKGLLKEG